MDPVVTELLKYGSTGAVIAVVLLLGRALGPALATVLPAWASTRARREDLLMEALQGATRVMAETVSVLQSLRAEVATVRRDQAELRSDVEHIAEQLDLPRPRTTARATKAATKTKVVAASLPVEAVEVSSGS
jgi:hypothetical protein